MNHRKIILATVLTLLTAPQVLTAQGDWTFQVPLSLTNVTADVTMGGVLCLVFQNNLDAMDAVPHVGSLTSGENGAQPGEAPSAWDGIDIPAGDFVGYNTFAIDASGNGPASVIVEVVAPEFVSSSLKISAKNWACALAFKINTSGGPGWFAVHPEFFAEDAPEATATADGTTLRGWIGGTIN